MASGINIVTGVLALVLAKRWNRRIGIPDGLLYWSTDLALATLTSVFMQLPAQVLFTEVNPPHVEATLVAFQGTLFAISSYVLGQLSAWVINTYFVHVSLHDLSRYWLLCVVSIIGALWPFLWLWLVPNTKNIKQYRENMYKHSTDLFTSIDSDPEETLPIQEVPEEDENDTLSCGECL
jgi:hypothetical protein